MTDEELLKAALSLLKNLVEQRLLIGGIRQSASGEWVTSTIFKVVSHGLVLEVRLEDDAESIASATHM